MLQNPPATLPSDDRSHSGPSVTIRSQHLTEILAAIKDSNELLFAMLQELQKPATQ